MRVQQVDDCLPAVLKCGPHGSTPFVDGDITGDAFGHRHKANIGEVLAAEVTARTGIETLSIELTYDLRSGQPDALDQIVASTFANVAMDLVAVPPSAARVLTIGGLAPTFGLAVDGADPDS